MPASSTARHLAGATALAAALACPAPHAQPQAVLPAVNSYALPPYVLAGGEPGGGLAEVFVEQLNGEIRAGPRFSLANLPRRRLESQLNDPAFAGAALFLTPQFLRNATPSQARWSAPVMTDENLIVSIRPMRLSSLDGLQGLRFGGIAGHVYRALAPLIEDGRIARDDAGDHVANLKKLCLGRVDFVVISRSELAGTAPLAPCGQAFRPVSFPEPQVILRQVLVRTANDQETGEVLDAVARVACSERWRSALAAYGLARAGCATKPAGDAGRSAHSG
jgi:polar amino acid transport system substrate-binding protein